ncbi:outer membrane beta-barrel protein [uncultured Desulfuromonas sp.]|uniref:outer membrane protein n=1 Tax=uncultured Desulfuromonas sp. TaxID=181013 RepID=UPI00262C24FA|nr:outer membrane beta-barrel protein [uncultured Desulfuromonas sp.]
MIRRLALPLGVLCLTLFAAPALAGEEGPYIGAHFGALLLDEAENTGRGGSFHLDFDPGTLYGGAFGYDLGENHPRIGRGRVELEVSSGQSDLKEAHFLDGKVDAEGDISALSFMLNTVGESRNDSAWTPFIGFGFGYALVSLNNARASGQPLADDEDGVFAWQALAGISLAMHRLVNLDFAYRYFSAVEPEFKDATGETFESEYSSHRLSLGLRVGF